MRRKKTWTGAIRETRRADWIGLDWMMDSDSGIVYTVCCIVYTVYYLVYTLVIRYCTVLYSILFYSWLYPWTVPLKYTFCQSTDARLGVLYIV